MCQVCQTGYMPRSTAMPAIWMQKHGAEVSSNQELELISER